MRRPASTAAIVIALAASTVTGLAMPARAAATQQPVDSNSMADPGVTLYDGNFYAFSTGSFGLWESTAPQAGGPWTAPANVLSTSGIPAWRATAPPTT
jgi:hypothetical protein